MKRKQSSFDQEERAVKEQKEENRNGNDKGDGLNEPKRKKIKTETEQEETSVCPYIITVNRKILDFDFEKLCSVTLSNINVYACLVCGKYFQGKGLNTPASIHSLDEDHHIFMNLHTGKIYCLPDNYEVKDNSLNDIKYNLNPTYTKEQIENNELDKITEKVVSLNGNVFYPGYVGLNNLKHTDGINVVVHALAHVIPVRNFFLEPDNLRGTHNTLVVLGELIRKIWNPRSFKGHVSPHELLQAIADSSKRRFRIGEPTDPVQFLTWFLNFIHKELQLTSSNSSGSKKNITDKPTIISNTFQGKILVTSEQISPKENEEHEGKNNTLHKMRALTQKKVPFMLLTLDVPPAPLFKDEYERNIIPQIPIYAILNKFDGKTETTVPLANGMLEKKTYRITKLPQYLIFHIKRFSTNNFFKEKNPTIVNFPVHGLDLSEYVQHSTAGVKYNLIANICHEGDANTGFFKIHLLHRTTGKWLEIQDLEVQEVLPQMISVSESYIQIYESSTH
jgi:U4/U6.U5 tri-snRNP-associated protein 2